MKSHVKGQSLFPAPAVMERIERRMGFALADSRTASAV
jgi:hypothetical protein